MTIESTENDGVQVAQLRGAHAQAQTGVDAACGPSAASSSSGQAASTPSSGALQRYPENQAMTVQAGSSASTPDGFTMLRSRMRAHSSVSERIGSVISHSRSQSGLASSPEADRHQQRGEPQHEQQESEADDAARVLNSTVTPERVRRIERDMQVHDRVDARSSRSRTASAATRCRG